MNEKKFYVCEYCDRYYISEEFLQNMLLRVVFIVQTYMV